jgi:hypothetical protein
MSYKLLQKLKNCCRLQWLHMEGKNALQARWKPEAISPAGGEMGVL